jgi:GNAT superfamily N-acetyltransferase
VSGFEIERAGAEAIEELEPLWNALREHHGPQMPMFGEVRDREGSWRKRRPHYEQLLAKPGSFALIARRDGRAVGYAIVELDHDGSTSWTVEKGALLETISVLPEERGTGVGGALLERVRAELEGTGAEILVLSVVAVNAGAIRFYERHGFTPAFIEMAQRL